MTASTTTPDLGELGQQLRVDSVRATQAAGAGHATSAMSAADLMAVLLARHLRYDFDAPSHPGNDHLVFSKGHASPLLYSMYRAAGAITDDELLSYRRHGSRLEGHPTPRLPWVDVGTGSLGQGFPIGVGLAEAIARLEHGDPRVWVLCGDSELAEGSVWEAFEHAGSTGLENLTVMVDVNRLGQVTATRHGWDTTAYAERIAAFGWHVIEIDGHDVDQIDKALLAAAGKEKPTAIIARTKKGKGASEVEDQDNAHGKPVPDSDAAIAELGGKRDIRVEVHEPRPASRVSHGDGALQLPSYEVGSEQATRTAYGKALVALGHARPDVIGLDGEVGNSTRGEYFAKEFPERFLQCYIAEQQMTAAAVGLQARGWTPYMATFAAFLTRAYDFFRMAAVSRANLRVAGSHAGVEIGMDGPSQMGLEDLAQFRTIAGSTVLYPCDGNQAAHLTANMANVDGICYMRTTRGGTPVIYPPDEEFPIGGSKVPRSSAEDSVTIVAAGVTLHQALAAADRLAEHGVSARVVDLYSIKPVDTATLHQAAADTGRILTVEDHWPQGGLGEAVAESFTDGTTPPRLRKLAVRAMPASATPEEQLHDAGIDAEAIAAAARELTGEQARTTAGV